MRVLVCGDRLWTQWQYLFMCLDILHKEKEFSCVIEGEAKGADSYARLWAESRGINVEAYPAEWHKYRHAAGPIRNKQMLDEGKPDIVVAFHHNLAASKGTKNMVELAKKHEIPVIILDGRV